MTFATRHYLATAAQYQRRYLSTASTMSKIAPTSIAVTQPPRRWPSLSENGTRPAHHANGTATKFQCPWPSFRYQEASHWFRAFTSSFVNSPKPGSDVKAQIPTQTPTWGAGNDGQGKLTWLGHASYLLELPTPPGATRGARIIFDPVFSKRCSPSQMIGPARYTDTPCKIEDVPAVDAIVLSHDHYDHTDIPTLKALLENPECNAHIFVGLNSGALHRKELKLPAERVHELDWWDERMLSIPLPGASTARVRITSTPSQHVGGRTGFDRWASLWSAWIIEELPEPEKDTVGKTVYFAGDTGYRTVREGEEEEKVPVCPAFTEVGERFGGVDVALLPIGAYAPRWMWSNLHASPADAVCMMRDVRAKKALAMHWGTWVLTTEPVLEPPQLLRKECERAGVRDDEFLVPALGESVLF